MKVKPEDVNRFFGEMRDFKITATLAGGERTVIYKRAGRHWRREAYRSRLVADERLVKYVKDDRVVTEDYLRSFFSNADLESYLIESNG